MAGDMVPSAADGEEEPVFSGEIDAVDDVGLTGTADDETRTMIDRQVLLSGAFLVR